MDIVLHLGAHKTASTYLQSLLEKNIVPLERHQVGFANPKTLRPMFGIAPRRSQMKPRVARNEARAWALRQVIETANDLQRKRLVISEEQLLGSLRQLFAGKGLYRDVPGELEGVVSALGHRPVTVMMALRSYDTFLISAYGQVLTGWKYIAFTQALREYLVHESRGWPEIVTEVMQALPRGSTLKFWKYETFGAQEENVLNDLVGEDVVESMTALNAKPGLGPSVEGIDALEKIASSGTPPDIETIRRTLRLYGKDKGFSGYNPWTSAEREKLAERYRRDIELMQSLWPDAMIGAPDPFGMPGGGLDTRAASARRQPLLPITNLQRQIMYRRPAIDTF